MKKYLLFMLMGFTLMLSACSQTEEEKIQVYLENKSTNFYDFSVVDITDGKLNIEVKMLSNSDTRSSEDVEFDVRVETKASLEAVKHYSKEHLDVVKEVNLYFVTRESNKTVAEINASNDTILGTNWRDLDNNELPQIVDGYKYYGVSN
ncbi:hypothetical protein M3193_13455 [Sporosarcina luteola]|uniref:hypothetical protein n=1 Tax=Sporosarcina luteola TaxID=582850 RepID=UPI00203B47F8|nr:hypothetical protein [Sporosarcina luteola]MCM3745141.1 hypothetical protein [Sporosarcina luteola]